MEEVKIQTDSLYSVMAQEMRLRNIRALKFKDNGDRHVCESTKNKPGTKSFGQNNESKVRKGMISMQILNAKRNTIITEVRLTNKKVYNKQSVVIR